MKYLIYFIAVLALFLATDKLLSQAQAIHIVNQVSLATTTPIKRTTKPIVKSLPLTPTQIAHSNKIEVIFGKEMVKVIKCESRFLQHNLNGTTLISPTSDAGLMQINQIHWPRAKKLGLDIFNSVNDNIIMGKIIYDEREKLTGNGAEAWSCWRLIAKQ